MKSQRNHKYYIIFIINNVPPLFRVDQYCGVAIIIATHRDISIVLNVAIEHMVAHIPTDAMSQNPYLV